MKHPFMMEVSVWPAHYQASGMLIAQLARNVPATLTTMWNLRYVWAVRKDTSSTLQHILVWQWTLSPLCQLALILLPSTMVLNVLLATFQSTGTSTPVHVRSVPKTPFMISMLRHVSSVKTGTSMTRVGINVCKSHLSPQCPAALMKLPSSMVRSVLLAPYLSTGTMRQKCVNPAHKNNTTTSTASNAAAVQKDRNSRQKPLHVWKSPALNNLPSTTEKNVYLATCPDTGTSTAKPVTPAQRTYTMMWMKSSVWLVESKKDLMRRAINVWRLFVRVKLHSGMVNNVLGASYRSSGTWIAWLVSLVLKEPTMMWNGRHVWVVLKGLNITLSSLFVWRWQRKEKLQTVPHVEGQLLSGTEKNVLRAICQNIGTTQPDNVKIAQ